MRLAALAALLSSAVPASVYGQAMEPDQVPVGFTLTTKPHTYNAKSTADGGVLGSRSNGSLLGIDSVVNWSSYFYLFGLDLKDRKSTRLNSSHLVISYAVF